MPHSPQQLRPVRGSSWPIVFLSTALALASLAIPPVRGQDRTPRVLKGCVRSQLPAGVAGVDPRATEPLSPNPLRGLRWYVDPVEPAYRSYRTFVRKHRRPAASLLWRIAREPRFRWFGRWNSPVRRRVRNYLRCAAAVQPGAVPLMVVMRHQGKGCGGG